MTSVEYTPERTPFDDEPMSIEDEIEREFPGATEAIGLDGEAVEEALIDRLGLLGEDILAELRHLRMALGSASRSSVEIKTSTRGVDVTVKSYEGSDTGDAANAAMAEYVRVVAEINQRLVDALNGAAKP